MACVAGYWLICVGSIGVQYAFGLTYVLIMATFPDTSRADTALVGSLCAGLMEGLGGLYVPLASEPGPGANTFRTLRVT